MPEEMAGWYGVRCLFRRRDREPGRHGERMTLWRARSFDHAHELAWQEASRHAEDSGIEYLNFSQVYASGETGDVQAGMVVFSGTS